MFFFVLEFLFYAALIILGIGVILSILGSETFWNTFTVVLMIGAAGVAVWGLVSMPSDAWPRILTVVAVLLAVGSLVSLALFKTAKRLIAFAFVIGSMIAVAGSYVLEPNVEEILNTGLITLLFLVFIVGMAVNRQLNDWFAVKKRARKP